MDPEEDDQAREDDHEASMQQAMVLYNTEDIDVKTPLY